MLKCKKICNLKSVKYGRQINKSIEKMSENLENKYWVYEFKKKSTAHDKIIKPTTKRYIIQYMAQAKRLNI